MKTYDFAFGLGRACACTQTMRRAGLQYLSLPWDWIAVDFDHNSPDLLYRVDIICNDFRDWFNREDFVYRGPNAGPGKDHYQNARNGVIFLHDFPKGVPLDESFPAIKEKYARRVARFLQMIKSAQGPILVVCMDSPMASSTPIGDCLIARKRLIEHFPGAQFEFLKITLEPGRSLTDKIDETPAEGLYHIAFDYKDYRPGRKEYDVDQVTVAELLKERFAVRDYRTTNEIRAMRERTRAIKMREAGASSRLGYFFLRLKRRIGKLLP